MPSVYPYKHMIMPFDSFCHPVREKCLNFN